MNISYWPFMIYRPIWFQAGLGYDSAPRGKDRGWNQVSVPEPTNSVVHEALVKGFG